MRIFVSSSFEDLKEHRAAAIRVLRQLGHEVLAMEDIIAASTAPLSKVIEMVDRCDAYVGIFAWRYGYIPGRPATPGEPVLDPPVEVAGASYGKTSITHYEYLRAVERKLPIMAFLLDEHCPWAPQLIDGFDTIREDAPASADDIRGLRLQLQQERVVSWFTTPTDLEARVSAAVTTAGLTAQLDLQETTALDAMANAPTDDAEPGIEKAILTAGDRQRALKLDLKSTWWSTRLYLIAALADRLTCARRILVVDSSSKAAVTSPPPSVARGPVERFVGQLSTTAIRSTIGPRVAAIAVFEKWLEPRPMPFGDAKNEVRALLEGWRDAFGDPSGTYTNEEKAKVDVTPELLRRWFDDSMLQQPVHIADLQKASVVDLLRLLDYPNDYVPVLTRHFDSQSPAPQQQQASERVEVIDKTALNARLARSYLVELMDRARLK